MRGAVASTTAELEALAPLWDELADAAAAPALARPFWCLPWARHLGAWRPMVHTVHDGGQLVGLLPLQGRSLGGMELLRFLGHGLGTVTGPVVAPGRPAVAQSLWNAALGGPVRLAQLLELRAHGPGLDGLDGHPHVTVGRDRCPVVDCAGTFDDYLATRTKKVRENLRRAERTARSRGRAHAVETVATPERWTAVRHEILHVWDRAEAARPRQHLLRGRFAPFTDDLLASAATAGHLRLLVGRIDGAPVSFGVTFRTGGTLSYWVTRFDPAFAAAAVGVLMLREVIALGFREGCDQVDLLIGDTDLKRRWSTDGYETVSVIVGSSVSVLAAGRVALVAVARARSSR